MKFSQCQWNRYDKMKDDRVASDEGKKIDLVKIEKSSFDEKTGSKSETGQEKSRKQWRN